MKTGFTDKQAHILTVAEELIADKGFHGTSVREICSAAGINVAMISYYFGSKEKMMASLYRFRVERTLENFSAFTDELDGKTPTEQMKILVAFIVNHILKFSYFHGFVTQEWQSTAEVKDTLQEFYKEFAAIIVRIVDAGNASGDFNCKPAAEDLLATMIGTIIFVIRNRNFYEKYIDEDADYFAAAEERIREHLTTTMFGLLRR